MKKLIISKLKGVYTGSGFKVKQGRKIQNDDISYLSGPIDIICDQDSGLIVNILSTDNNPHDPLAEYLFAENQVATAGFIDPHTHHLFFGDRSFEYFLRWQGKTYGQIAQEGGGIAFSALKSSENLSSEYFEQKIKTSLLNCFNNGVSTIEVKSGYGVSTLDEILMLRILKKIKSEKPFKNNILSTYLGLHFLPKGENEDSFVKDRIDALDTIAEESLAQFVDAFPEKGFFSLESAKRFFDAAKKLGFSLKLHSDEITDMKASQLGIDMGALSIDHLQQINDTSIAALDKSETVATFLPATSFYLDIDYVNARKIIDSGAQYSLATDFNPGTAPNSSLHFTHLLAASKLKMSAAEILYASSYGSSLSLGLEKDRGILEKGYRAHINLWSTEVNEFNEQNILQSLLLNQNKPQKVIINSQEFKITS